MEQSFSPNKKYKIKTPYGWESFEGVVKNHEEKAGKELTFEDGSIIVASDDHRFYIKGEEIKTASIQIGDVLDGVDNKEVVSIKETLLPTSYDIFNTESHTVIANDINTHQCDEFAFVKPSIASEFWTAIQPVLSCVTGDTLVLSQDGFRYIEDYHLNKKVGDYFEIENELVYGKNGMEPVSHGYVSPESDTVIITTTSGRKLEVTLNHPLWALQDSLTPTMIKAKDLKANDLLRLEIGMETFGNSLFANTVKEAFTADKENQLAFLQSLFETNSYRSDNKTLREIQLLLANNSIHSFIRGNSIVLDLDEHSRLFNGVDKVITYIDVNPYTRLFTSMMRKDKFDVESFVKGVDEEYREELLGSFNWERIESIIPSKNKTYDFTVPNTHSFLQNGILGSNTGGSCIITSTPNSDEDQFAKIWFGAINKTDQYGNELETKAGRNGFYGLKITWDKHPERDDEWAKPWRESLGAAKFMQEFNCLCLMTIVNILVDGEEKEVTIK